MWSVPSEMVWVFDENEGAVWFNIWLMFTCGDLEMSSPTLITSTGTGDSKLVRFDARVPVTTTSSIRTPSYMLKSSLAFSPATTVAFWAMVE